METTSESFESLFHRLRRLKRDKDVSALMEANPAFARFFELAALDDEEWKRQLLLANPMYLSMSIVGCIIQDPKLLESLGALYHEFGVAIESSGQQIRATTHDERYPLGQGPIERIWERVDRGEIDPTEALAEARDPELASRLSSIYVSALSKANLAVMRANDFHRAAWRQRVVLAAIESIGRARPLFNEADAWSIRKSSGAAWVEIATLSFWEIADLRVFDHAVAVADALIEECERRNDELFLGRILVRKGILFLDPFTANRPHSENYARQIEEWLARGREAMGADALELEKPRALPDPYEALQWSIATFRRALDVGKGFDRLVLLAALSQALIRARLLLAPVDLNELQQFATEGLSLARASGDRGRIEQLTQILSSAKESGTLRRVRLAESSLSYLVAMTNVERARIQEWIKTLDEYADRVGKFDLTREPMQIFRSLPDGMDYTERICTLVLLATICLGYDRELDGLEILGDQRMARGRYPANLVDAVRWLSAILAVNAGSTKVAERKIGEALSLYVSSLDVFASLHLLESMRSCLARIHDMARNAVAKDDLLVALYNFGLSLERSMSTPSLANLQLILQAANAALFDEKKVSAAHVFCLWQIAKGLRFATTAQRGLAELTHLDGPDWRSVNSLLAKVDIDTDPVAAASSDTRHDTDLFTYAASLQDTRDATDSKPSARENYDRMLEATLVDAAALSRQLPFEQFALRGLADVQKSLGRRTVLLNFFLGQSFAGEMTLYLMAVAAEESHLVCIAQRDVASLIQVTDGGLMHPFAPLISNVREGIQEDPLPGDVASDGAFKRLGKCYEMLFAGFASVLDKLHSNGKTHLCIVPHGPLHFFPFHLLGHGDVPLAAKWIVTYLPNLALLGIDARRPRGPRDRATGVTAFACGQFASPDYPDLPHAVEEATAIAAVFGREPLLEDKFDRFHVFAALTSGNRYVHFAGHGEMDVAAPCFHHVLMAPRNRKDQRLYAFQLQQLDLRGIDLLTFGSCETALGRFDMNDNLRGLPAYFFLCGVSAIIGTLWEVETQSSLTFFTELYRRLKTSSNRLDAFAHAQRITRERHPEYRDWGAFCYLGDWNEEVTRSVVTSLPGTSGLRWTNLPI